MPDLTREQTERLAAVLALQLCGGGRSHAKGADLAARIAPTVAAMVAEAMEERWPLLAESARVLAESARAHNALRKRIEDLIEAAEAHEADGVWLHRVRALLDTPAAPTGEGAS